MLTYTEWMHRRIDLNTSLVVERKRKDALGLCTAPSCENSQWNGHKHCRKCTLYQREYARKRRAKEYWWR